MATLRPRNPYCAMAFAWQIAVVIFCLLFLAIPFVEMVKSMIADPQLLARQLLIGVTNGAYIALIALGYTLVYGIVELINFAHGDLYMLGAFFSLSLIGTFSLTTNTPWVVRAPILIMVLIATMGFTAGVNLSVDQFGVPALAWFWLAYCLG
jgi:ABC-type branched-subunit amino acid transport system permease subunit